MINATEERARARAARNERVPFDWRIVKIDQTRHCGEEWIAEKGIKAVFIYYLYDANRHVHICSFTPTLECFPVAAEVTFTSETAWEADEGESELALMQDEESCSYFEVSDAARFPSRPAGAWCDAPEREPGEDCETYYTRAVEAMTEYFQGNPPYFERGEP
jgi:hypothetical protein